MGLGSGRIDRLVRSFAPGLPPDIETDGGFQMMLKRGRKPKPAVAPAVRRSALAFAAAVLIAALSPGPADACVCMSDGTSVVDFVATSTGPSSEGAALVEALPAATAEVAAPTRGIREGIAIVGGLVLIVGAWLVRRTRSGDRGRESE